MASASTSPSSSTVEYKTERDVVDAYTRLRQELSQLADRVQDLEAQLAEHALVAKTMRPMEKGRRAYRLVRFPFFFSFFDDRSGEEASFIDFRRIHLSLFPTKNHSFSLCPGRRRPRREDRGRGPPGRGAEPGADRGGERISTDVFSFFLASLFLFPARLLLLSHLLDLSLSLDKKKQPPLAGPQ